MCSLSLSLIPALAPLQHLTTLLASCDMQVVLSVLNLLYVFSKRSNYITRLGSDKRTPLLARLQHLAEVNRMFLLSHQHQSSCHFRGGK